MPRISIWTVLIFFIIIISRWIVFKKMGRQGWESIVPCYDVYVLCNLLYGQGLKVLLLLLPFYNIYFYVRLLMDLAKTFNKDPGFGIGLTFLPVVFFPMLAFSNATYGDGSYANNESDFVSGAVDKMKDLAKESGLKMPVAGGGFIKKEETPSDKLRELSVLRDQGILSEEEYQAKKSELIQQI